MRVGFHTFGCKLNQYETESLASSLRERGHTVVGPEEGADAFIINTCTVTGKADHKARAAVRALGRRNPRALLIVTGCAAQLEAETFSALGGNVLVVPQSRKGELLALAEGLGSASDVRAALESLGRSSIPAAPDPFAFRFGNLSFHTRAFLKIQDGCDGLCAYCRVPQARGGSVNLDVDEVLKRTLELESRGYRELVVTGINISTYCSRGVSLPGLLARMLKETSSVRFRLSSLEPEALTEELALVLAHPRVCPHFHIPAQSGSDAVLAGMRRRYRASRIVEGMQLLRRAGTDPFLAGDFITGFPGETPDDHEQTVRLVEEARFASLHVFPFSPRPGTAAARLTPSVPQRIRDERARRLISLSRKQKQEYSLSWVGRVVDVFLEDAHPAHVRPSDAGAGSAASVSGVSGNYLKVHVNGLPPEEAHGGKIARARICRSGDVCSADFLEFA